MEAKEEEHDAPLDPFLKFANSRASWRNGRWHCRIYIRCPGPLPDVLSVRRTKRLLWRMPGPFCCHETEFPSTQREREVKQIEIKEIYLWSCICVLMLKFKTFHVWKCITVGVRKEILIWEYHIFSGWIFSKRPNCDNPANR